MYLTQDTSRVEGCKMRKKLILPIKIVRNMEKRKMGRTFYYYTFFYLPEVGPMVVEY